MKYSCLFLTFNNMSRDREFNEWMNERLVNAPIKSLSGGYGDEYHLNAHFSDPLRHGNKLKVEKEYIPPKKMMRDGTQYITEDEANDPDNSGKVVILQGVHNFSGDFNVHYKDFVQLSDVPSLLTEYSPSFSEEEAIEVLINQLKEDEGDDYEELDEGPVTMWSMKHFTLDGILIEERFIAEPN